MACACRGGGAGVQICDDSGSRLGPCDCSGASVAAPAQPTEPPSWAPTAQRSAPTLFGGSAWSLRQPSARSGRWYGWGALIADGVGIGASVLGGALMGSRQSAGAGLAFTIGGGVTLGFASPIIHWSRRNVWRGFVSLALRTVLPTVGLLVGLAADSRHAGGMLVGAGVGQVVASTLDIAWLSRDP